MSSRERVRVTLIALFAIAAVLNVTGNETGARPVVILSYVCFFAGVLVFMNWRRRLAQTRRARVFDREAKTDETRTRPDE